MQPASALVATSSSKAARAGLPSSQASLPCEKLWNMLAHYQRPALRAFRPGQRRVWRRVEARATSKFSPSSEIKRTCSSRSLDSRVDLGSSDQKARGAALKGVTSAVEVTHSGYAMEDQGQTVPPPRDLVAHYSYSSWSALFPPRFLIPSAVIPLEDDFRDYLRQDGMIMPIECDSGPQRVTCLPCIARQSLTMAMNEQESQLSDDEEDEDAMSTSSSSSSTAPAPPSFPSLIPQITSSILSLSQSPYASSISGVYPKLNFTAPQDASFLIPQGDGILRCKTAEDVVMVLKGSGFVTWDLDRVEEAQQAEEEEEDEPIEKQVEGLNLRGGARASRRPAGLELVLKRWTALEPAGEFRAFVRGSRLLGMSFATSWETI